MSAKGTGHTYGLEVFDWTGLMELEGEVGCFVQRIRQNETMESIDSGEYL